jgi:hypothetical protein
MVQSQIEALYDAIITDELGEDSPLDALWLFTKVLQQPTVTISSKTNHETLIAKFARLIESDDVHSLTVVMGCLLAYLQKIDAEKIRLPIEAILEQNLILKVK